MIHYLKLDKNKDYEIEFLSREPEKMNTPFGTRYNYGIKYNGEDMILKATEKLREVIDFYFGLVGNSILREKNKNNPNKAKLFMGTYLNNYQTYTIIPNLNN